MLAEFSTTPTHLATLGNRTLQYRNSNRLVRSTSGRWDIGFQKTGYIVEAGRCLTMLTKLGGHDLIMVLLDADTNNARLTDAERMRRWVWRSAVCPTRSPVPGPRGGGQSGTVVAKKDRTGKGKDGVRQGGDRRQEAQDTAEVPRSKEKRSASPRGVRHTFPTQRRADPKKLKEFPYNTFRDSPYAPGPARSTLGLLLRRRAARRAR
jgi:D-alanyl-D-alanine carboxypeptidase